MAFGWSRFTAGLSGEFSFLTLPCRLPRNPTDNLKGIVQAAGTLFNGGFFQKSFFETFSPIVTILPVKGSSIHCSF